MENKRDNKYNSLISLRRELATKPELWQNK